MFWSRQVREPNSECRIVICHRAKFYMPIIGMIITIIYKIATPATTSTYRPWWPSGLRRQYSQIQFESPCRLGPRIKSRLGQTLYLLMKFFRCLIPPSLLPHYTFDKHRVDNKCRKNRKGFQIPE